MIPDSEDYSIGIREGRCVECGTRMADDSREANSRQHGETADRADRHEYKKWDDTQGQKAA